MNPADRFEELVRDDTDLLALEFRIARRADQLPAAVAPDPRSDRERWLQAEREALDHAPPALLIPVGAN